MIDLCDSYCASNKFKAMLGQGLGYTNPKSPSLGVLISWLRSRTKKKTPRVEPYGHDVEPLLYHSLRASLPNFAGRVTGHHKSVSCKRVGDFLPGIIIENTILPAMLNPANSVGFLNKPLKIFLLFFISVPLKDSPYF